MANILTGCRILFSLPLLLIPLSSVWLYVLYLLCGLTDMVDGTVARKTGTVSEFGEKLDTAADFVFLGVALFRLLPVLDLPTWLWVWILIIAGIKAINLILGIVIKGRIVAIHSVLNKITGACLFILPLLLPVVDIQYGGGIVCALATVAAIHEFVVIATKRCLR